MKILVINTGSSSIKYELFDMAGPKSLASGLAEKIGEDTGLLKHKAVGPDGQILNKTVDGRIANHHEGLTRIVDLLCDPADGVVADKSDISAVGHRVVHGGETFHDTTLIDEKVLDAIKEYIPLAPLHNPPNLEGIEVARAIFPDAPQVAVFDTAFHQTMPEEAFLYALPYELYEKHGVRKYGFHGTSHAYVADKAAEFLGRPLGDLKMVTIHLGNGASMAALKEGRCVDTTMGLTPLAGLVMGTRCGDVDPALPFFLSDHLDMSLKKIDTLLNKESGLKGLCGTNDMREVLSLAEDGSARARAALKVYAFRIKKYIGAFLAVLGGLDVIVFTAGIGENAPQVRALCCEGLVGLGIEISPEKNESPSREVREIGTGKVRILVAPTDEELRIAQESLRMLKASV